MSPWAPKRPCSTPRCPHLAPCPVHGRPTASWARPASGAHRRVSIPPSVRRQVKPEGALCYLCRTRTAEEIDHIVPLSAGGDPAAVSNMAPICKPCHRRKTARESVGARRW